MIIIRMVQNANALAAQLAAQRAAQLTAQQNRDDVGKRKITMNDRYEIEAPAIRRASLWSTGNREDTPTTINVRMFLSKRAVFIYFHVNRTIPTTVVMVNVRLPFLNHQRPRLMGIGMTYCYILPSHKYKLLASSVMKHRQLSLRHRPSSLLSQHHQTSTYLSLFLQDRKEKEQKWSRNKRVKTNNQAQTRRHN